MQRELVCLLTNSVAHAFKIPLIRNHARPSRGLWHFQLAEWIYIGQTDNIQGDLMAHLQQPGSSLLTRQPKGFVYELCTSGMRPGRQKSLVSEYSPICNPPASR